VAEWSKSVVRQLSLVSRTEDYEYDKIIVGDNTDPNLVWFVLNVSQPRLLSVNQRLLAANVQNNLAKDRIAALSLLAAANRIVRY